jgi:poly-beta-1,6-N-acetyl-D-glucosamine synthase
MWWLIIPVAIYSTGIFVLWRILQRTRAEGKPAAKGIELVPEVAAALGNEMVSRVVAAPVSITVPEVVTAPVRTPVPEVVTAPIGVTVSVVVAARNEEKIILRLLESLAKQDYPGNLLEVIVINDNSTDRTPIVVSEFIAGRRQQPAVNIRLIYNTFQGKKSAVRHAVEKAAGKLILLTDADCIVGSGWVSAYAAFFSASNADMIIGEVYQKPGRGFASYFGSFEFSALQAVSEAAILAGHPVMCSAASMAVRKDVYLRHAGALRDDIASGDDVFLLHAVKRSGGSIMHIGDAAAAAVTDGAVTVAALLRQRARWASKAYYYSDPATLTLAAATAACNAAVAAAAAASFFSVKYLPLTGLLYAIRLIPDLLITWRNFKKREEHPPLPLFILSELIYPFYFITIALLSLFPSSRHFRSRT